MAVYELTFTPAGPYFFGNEKSFRYPGQRSGGAYSNSYFIRSEELPSQSTILGAIRYIMIPHLWGEPDCDAAENAAAIGRDSFDPDSGEPQDFGRIRSVSPVFIRRGDEKLIPVPLNHKAASDGKQMPYRPFSGYEKVITADGEKQYTGDYDPKVGLASGFLSLKDGQVYPTNDLIVSSERVGINRGSSEDGFFKKEYRQLKKTDYTATCSFAVFAELESEPLRKIVTLGQGQSPFAVSARVCENTLEAEAAALLSGCPEGCALYYCLSDCMVKGNPCDGTAFASFRTKDYRSYTTKYAENRKRVSKGEILHRLVRAGSIFIVPRENETEWLARQRRENAELIGYNHFVRIGG